MADSQFVVRRTFVEVDRSNLKELDFFLRRSRCMSESMAEGLPLPAPVAVKQHSDTIAVGVGSAMALLAKRKSIRTTVSTDFAGDWSEESDDNAGGSGRSSGWQTPEPAPDAFMAQPQAETQSSRREVRRVELWGAERALVRTTVLLRNLLPTSTCSDLCALLDAQGFRGLYDFIYVPANFRRMVAFGYAFANFVSNEAAEAALRHFQGFHWSLRRQATTLESAWSDPHQGYEVHVERYRNCPVMHPSIADEYKPIILVDGVRVPFPKPTKPLAAPRDVRRKHAA